MKKRLIPVLGAAGLALSGLSAHASIFQYNNGDLILDFSSSAASDDVEIDIGSVSSLNNAALANGGTVALSGAYYDVSTQLLSTFGGNLNGVSFSVVGTLLGAGAPTDWLTDPRTGAGPNTPLSNLASGKQTQVSGVVDKIEGVGVGTGIVPWSSANPADPVGNTANVAIIPNTSASSYTKSVGATFLGAPLNPKNTAPGSFTSGEIVSDLFEYDPTGGTGHSLYEGDFTLNSNGTLDYTTALSPAPEPATFGVLAGALLLIVTLKNKLQQNRI